MRAYLRSVRLAPKKANLMAKMVRGKPVPDAVYLLERTTKKSARIFEKLLRSAIANASHNDKQDPQMMIVKTVIVNQGAAYHRGVPMARGRVRPIRKFLSHIEIELGFAADKKEKKEKKEKMKKTEKKERTEKSEKKTTAKKATTSNKQQAASEKKSSSSSSASSSSSPSS